MDRAIEIVCACVFCDGEVMAQLGSVLIILLMCYFVHSYHGFLVWQELSLLCSFVLSFLIIDSGLHVLFGSCLIHSV